MQLHRGGLKHHCREAQPLKLLYTQCCRMPFRLSSTLNSIGIKKREKGKAWCFVHVPVVDLEGEKQMYFWSLHVSVVDLEGEKQTYLWSGGSFSSLSSFSDPRCYPADPVWISGSRLTVSWTSWWFAQAQDWQCALGLVLLWYPIASWRLFFKQ
jgi:hypothetical protein